MNQLRLNYAFQPFPMNSFLHFLLFALFVSFAAGSFTPIKKPGYCSMVGHCSDPNDQWVNCVNNTPAIYPDSSIIDDLKALCPELEGQKVCCDKVQFGNLNSQLQQAQSLFEGCPACLSNIRKFWCEYSCSPNQAVFLDVMDFTTGTMGPVVNWTLYSLSDAYSTKFFESCKYVVMGSTGETIMEAVFGAHTYMEFFNYMGVMEPAGKSPIYVTYQIQDEFSLNNVSILYNCNEGGATMQCSCVDCPSTCPPIIHHDPPAQSTFVRFFGNRIDILDFCLMIGYVACLFIAIFFILKYPMLNCCHSSQSRENVSEFNVEERSNYHSEPTALVEKFFYRLGLTVGRHPEKIIVLSFLVTIIFSIGILRLEIVQDPVKLWAPPNSQVVKEKQMFDDSFGPFYRVENFIVYRTEDSRPSPTTTYDNIFYADVLVQLRDLENQLQNVRAIYNGELITWGTLCFRPMPGKGCMKQSVTEWWTAVDKSGVPLVPPFTNTTSHQDIMQRIQFCVTNNVDDSCLGSIGVPNEKHVVLGGYDASITNDSVAALQSVALITTYLLNNAPENVDRATAWEREFLKVLRAFPLKGLKISYTTESSIQDELSAQSSADIEIVSISYACMFFYVSLALGTLFPCTSLSKVLVRTKFALGFSSIIVVGFALTISVGFCSAVGVKATLIISEVIPFLVLAIGIDNVFIILNIFQSKSRKLSLQVRLAETIAEVGMSITLSALSECFAFGLGALTKMPAVQAFAIYAAVAVFADFILQLTCFSAILILDARRQEANRIECIPCVQVEPVGSPNYDNEFDNDGKQGKGTLYYPNGSEPQDHGNGYIAPSPGTSISDTPKKQRTETNNCLRNVFRDYYAPFILHRISKVFIIFLFIGWLFWSISSASHNLELGLDQRTALEYDSYLQDYFRDMYAYFRAGAPVYFVVNYASKPETTDFSVIDNAARVCTKAAGCATFSLANTMHLEKVDSDYSLIGFDVNMWIDDFYAFLRTPGCCRLDRKGNFCPPGPQPYRCDPCIKSAAFVNGMPPPDQFIKYLRMFLNTTTCGRYCGVCGTPHYADVSLSPIDIGNSTTQYQNMNLTTYPVMASRWRTYHVPLVNQSGYINALKSARRIADEISRSQNIPVFAYSVFYVYFDQYLYIGSVAVETTLFAGLAILFLCLILLRNLWASLIIVVTITMIVVDLLGLMAAFDILLNAISVVNLVMAIGISVEFCIHVTVSFMSAKGNHDERVTSALTNVGSSVFSGIFMTKFFGVIVLAFSQSALFQVYYFRMYMAICVLGGLHGLLFLPVLLSLFGPGENPSPLSRCFRNTKKETLLEYRSP